MSFLLDGECEGTTLVKIIEFDSEAGRAAYLDQGFRGAAFNIEEAGSS